MRLHCIFETFNSGFSFSSLFSKFSTKSFTKQFSQIAHSLISPSLLNRVSILYLRRYINISTPSPSGCNSQKKKLAFVYGNWEHCVFSIIRKQRFFDSKSSWVSLWSVLMEAIENTKNQGRCHIKWKFFA